jgi:hypothetical protein
VDRFADVDFAALRYLDVNEQQVSAEFGRPEDG